MKCEVRMGRENQAVRADSSLSSISKLAYTRCTSSLSSSISIKVNNCCAVLPSMGTVLCGTRVNSARSISMPGLFNRLANAFKIGQRSINFVKYSLLLQYPRRQHLKRSASVLLLPRPLWAPKSDPVAQTPTPRRRFRPYCHCIC